MEGGPLRVGEGGSLTRRGGYLTKNLEWPVSLYICDFEPILGLGADFDHIEILTILRVGEEGPGGFLRVWEGGPLRVGEGGPLRVGEGVPYA